MGAEDASFEENVFDCRFGFVRDGRRAAQADYLNGGFAADLGVSTYTGPSLQNATSITISEGYTTGDDSGSFSSIPNFFSTFSPAGEVTIAPLTGTFDATSTQSAYVPDNVSDLFVFGGTNGTEYDFNLTSLSEQYNSVAGLSLFGQGNVVDTTGGATTTPASFTLDGLTDSGSGNAASGSFTLSAAAVPEPATLGLLGIAAVGVMGRRRRV